MASTTTVHFSTPNPSGPGPDEREQEAGHVTVLLIDHESADRAVSRMVLEECGYLILEATSPAEAIAMCECRRRLDLLVIDVLAPGFHGPLLIKQLRLKFPKLKVLHVSGRNALAARPVGQSEGSFHFLHKPFMPIALMRKVTEVLGAVPPRV